MSEANRKEDVMAETEEILNEAAQETGGNAKETETGRDAREEACESADDPCGSSDSEQEPSEAAETQKKDSEAQDADGKRGFFGKKKEKKDPRDAQIEELTDKVRRNLAEFDNYRKRTEKEKSAMFEMGAKDIVERILPVIDNFERGLASIPEEAKGSAFASGMEMIYKQLLKNLEDAGVKPIEAVGQPFDPNFHNAVMHIEDENLGENVVAQELQKGYMYRDSVVRHSMVQVAN